MFCLPVLPAIQVQAQRLVHGADARLVRGLVSWVHVGIHATGWRMGRRGSDGVWWIGDWVRLVAARVHGIGTGGLGAGYWSALKECG